MIPLFMLSMRIRVSRKKQKLEKTKGSEKWGEYYTINGIKY